MTGLQELRIIGSSFGDFILRSLPAGIFDDLTELTTLRLNNNSLVSLPANVFSRLKKLQELRINNNPLSSLSADVFAGLTELRVLDMEGLGTEGLASLPPGIFDDLTSLTRLLLKRNQLRSLPENIFEPLTSLTELNLGNRLEGNPGRPFKPTVEAGVDQQAAAGAEVVLRATTSGAWGSNVIWQWTQVDGPQSTTAVANGVRLTDADTPRASFIAPEMAGTLYFRVEVTPKSGADERNFGTASTSDYMQVSTNAFPEVANPLLDQWVVPGTQYSFTFPENTFVDADGHTLTYRALRSDDTEPPSWLMFDAATRTFSGTPPAAATNTRISLKVRATDGNGGLIEDAFDLLVAASDVCLRTPAVRDALVSAIPAASDCFAVTPAQLATITSLDLSGERLVSLGLLDFGGLEKLTTLELHENLLTTLPARVFDGLTALTQLELYSNRLTSLPANAFAGLPKLTRLTLDNNELTTLTAGVFNGLTALTQLELYSNRLTTLPANIFEDLGQLQELQLDQNRLTSLPATVFAPLVKLRVLYLYENRLNALPDNIFSTLVELAELDLQDNPGVPFTLAVDAGANQTVALGADVTLRGATTGVWGDRLLSWQWTQVDGPSSSTPLADGVTATSAAGFNGQNVEFKAPDKNATLYFRLFATPSLKRLSISEDIKIPQGAVAGPPDWVTITVGAGNNAPEVANQIPDQPVQVATALSYTFPENSFVDADNESLSYTASKADGGELPSWLMFDRTTRTFSGTPPTSVGTLPFRLTVAVEATDPNNASVRDTFDVVVTETDVCNRSAGVRNLIVVNVSGINDCADVTPAQLANIPDISASFLLRTSGIKAGDFAGLTGLVLLNITSNNLRSLPANIFDPLTKLQTLRMGSNCYGGELPENLFARLAELTTLDLRSACRNSLPAGMFDTLTKLRSLNLENNSLRSLPAGVFDMLTELTTLNLAFNLFASNALRDDVFKPLTKLRSLRLNNNTGRGRPNQVFRPGANAGEDQRVDTGAEVNLQGMATGPWGDAVFWRWLQVTGARSNTGVSASDRVTLTDANSATPSFTAPAMGSSLHFRLQVRQARGAATSVSEGSDWVTIITNTAPEVADGISDQPAAVGVEFVYAIPAGAFVDADSRDTLAYTASQGDGTDLPGWLMFDTATATFSGTPQAAQLGRQTVKVTASDGMAMVSDSFDIVVAETDVCLRTPQVRDALVAAVPGASDCAALTLANLPGIQSLNLRTKGLVGLRSLDFGGLTGLNTLTLSDNQLAVLPEGIFDDLTALTTLTLSDNRLTALPANAFTRLASLTNLRINNNQLASLPSGAFARTPLQVLELAQNRLNALPDDLFQPLVTLRRLHLQGNPGAPFKPIVNAGADQTPAAGDTVMFTATVSGPWGPLALWQWTQVDANGSTTPVPVDARVALSAPTGDRTNFTAPASGTLYFMVVATQSPVPSSATGSAASDPEWVTVGIGNSAPVVQVLIPDGRARAGLAYSYAFPANTFSDPEGQALTYTATLADGAPLPSWLTFNPTTRTFAGIAQVVPGGTLSLKVMADDSNGGVGSDTFDIRISGTDVCGRTSEVRDAIVNAVAGVDDCRDLLPSHLANMQNLFVTSVNLTSVKSGDFAGLTGLIRLGLNANKLTSLPATIFSPLTGLQRLFLQGNNFTTLPANIFEPLPNLIHLSLASNRFESLPEGILVPLTKLTILSLSGNPGAPFRPTVDAGPDQSVLTGAQVSLAGRATGAWGNNVFWQWEQVDGPSSNTVVTDGVTLTGATSSTAMFTAPEMTKALHFRLVATPPQAVSGTAASLADWVTVGAGNLVPTLVTPIPDQAVMPGMAFSYTFPDNTFADADGDTLAYTATQTDGSALPAWLTFDAATRTFSDKLTGTNRGTPSTPSQLSLRVVANDGNGGVVSDVFDVAVAATDVCLRTPQVRDAILGQIPGVSDCLAVTTAQLADIDGLSILSGDIESLQARDFTGLTGLTLLNLAENERLTELPAGIFDPLVRLTRLLLSENGLTSTALPVGVFASLTALTGSTSLQLQGNPGAPFRPTADAGANQTVAKGAKVTLAATEVGAWGPNVTWAWTQVDGPQSNRAVPGGVTRTGATPSFTAPDKDATLHFKVIATPQQGVSATTGLAASTPDWTTVRVGAGNTSPRVTNALRDQGTEVGQAFIYIFANNTFSDTDGDTLTYTATQTDGTALPAWLTFTAANRTFSGTAQAGDAGTLSVQLTASDGTDEARDDFDIFVAPTSVCRRTPQVRDAILAAVTDVSDCAALTPANLAAISALDLESGNIDSLQAFDFVGLTGLTFLRLEVNSLSELPAGVFDPLAALSRLLLSDNNLTSLPAGVFSKLTGFTRTTGLQLQRNPGAPFSPIADAGADFSVAQGASVSLQGRSVGAWGDNVTWSWTQVDGEASSTAVTNGVRLSGAGSATPSFTAPAMNTTLHFRLTVTPRPGVSTASGTAASAPDWVKVTIGSGSRAPSVSGGIPDQVAKLDSQFSYEIPDGAFSDEDSDSLDFTATAMDGGALPAWLSFTDPRFSGMPRMADRGTLEVRVTATDGTSSVRDNFNILVAPTDVCARSDEVQAAIIGAVPGVGDCAELTAAELAGITLLNMSSSSIASLREGDFDGLTGLQILRLDGNSLASLPKDLFVPLTSLTYLNVARNTGSPFAPVLDAGADQSLDSDVMVTLSASVSGAWGDGVSLEWTQVDGAASNTEVSGGVALVGATTATASFTAPSESATLHFRVKATPTRGASDASQRRERGIAEAFDWVTVTVSKAVPTFSVSGPETVAEGAETASYTVSLSVEPAADVTVEYATADGTATAGSDYVATSATLTFTPMNWNTPQTVMVTITDDLVDEDEETFTFALSNQSSGTALSSTAASLTTSILDDDVRGLTLSTTALTVDEGATTTYTVVLATQPTAEVTVTVGVAVRDVSVDTDTVAEGVQKTLTFTPMNWNMPQTVTVVAAADDDVSFDEPETLTHSASGGDYESLPSASAPSVEVTVTEKDTAVFSVIGPARVPEDAGMATFTVSLSKAPGVNVVLDYATSDGTATAGSDYTETAGSGNRALFFRFSDWDTPRTVDVPITDDTVDEGDETFVFTLSNPQTFSAAGVIANLALSPTASSVITTITDNDTPEVTVSFAAATYSVAEGGSASFTLTLDADPERSVTIPLTAMNGTGVTSDDYSLPESVTFMSGETSKTLTFTATDDALDEDDETVTLGFGASLPERVTAGTTAQAQVTITDNDTRGVTLSNTTLSVIEGETGTYTVVLDSEPTGSVTVTPTVPSNAEISVAPSSLTFTAANWDEAQTVTVTAAEDEDLIADAPVTLTHSVSGADYASTVAGSVARCR